MTSKKEDQLPFGKPIRKRQPKKTVKVRMPEKDIQGMAEELCMALGIRFFRIPDKLLGFLRMYAPTWVRVFTARYLAGVPDLMLFKPFEVNRNEVLFLEIKTEAGKLSLNQLKWHSGLSVSVTYGWEQTEKVMRGFAK